MWGWLAANKDALVALAAVVVSPAVALFGLMLTQRNMTRSLAIQRDAMDRNFNVAMNQLNNAERQLRQQARVAVAGIVGGIERERLERFSSRCVRLLELFDERSNKENRLEEYAEPREFVRLGREMSGIANELELLVPEVLTSVSLEGLKPALFATATSGLVTAAMSKDIRVRMGAREEFTRQAREVMTAWHAYIGRLVDPVADDARSG